MAINAIIIWRIEPSDYEGNNSFFQRVCEQLDMQTIMVKSISELKRNGHHRISVEIEAWTTKRFGDDDAATDYLQDCLEKTSLPCQCNILINEICEN